MFENLNSKRTIREGVDLQALNFVKLSDLTGAIIKVDGFFFTKGHYGEQLVVVGNNYKINMPARAVEQFHKIEENEQMLKALLEGHCCIKDIAVVNTKNGRSTTVYKLADC